jgi:CRP/FNR family transcriptional regulator, cyclic AMP receptor protein
VTDGFDLAFAALDPSQRLALRELAVPRRYDRGEVLFHRGDDSAAAHALVDGLVKVSAITSDGREVVFGIAGPGSLVGDIAAVVGHRRSASARALVAVRSLALPGDVLREAIRSSPALAVLMLESAADRLAAADDQRLEFAGLDVLGRVARRLLTLADALGVPSDGGVVLDPMLSQEDLASWTAASREAVNRALAQLRSLGCVRYEGRRTVLADLEALRSYGRF